MSTPSGTTGDPSIDVDVYTPREQMILSWIGHVSGFISFLGGLWMFMGAWKRRTVNAFHRLMLGMY